MFTNRLLWPVLGSGPVSSADDKHTAAALVALRSVPPAKPTFGSTVYSVLFVRTEHICLESQHNVQSEE